jgi:hypothetical protein
MNRRRAIKWLGTASAISAVSFNAGALGRVLYAQLRPAGWFNEVVV